MRIISPFTDYYDGLQRLDTDFETKFRRKTQDDIGYDGILIPYSNFRIIGFAGRIFPFQKINRDGRIIHIFDPDQWEKTRNYFIKRKFQDPVDVVKEYLTYDVSTDFEKYGPIWIIYPQYDKFTRIIVNPKLEPLGFASVMPPHEAYNELYKWVVNQARPNRPIPVMSNDIKIEQAGFNLKTSFRHKK